MNGSVPAVQAKAVPTDAYLLDVREDDEWQAGHAPNAIHIPMSALAERAGEIPGDRDVYVICRSGGRSGRAVAALNQGGWRATNVLGGMQAWSLAGLPMEADAGATPSVI